MKTVFDKEFLDTLLVQAKENSRLCAVYDLCTTAKDVSQRMYSVMPEIVVPIHRHPNSAEYVLCLFGRVDEVLYDKVGNEVERIHLCTEECVFGCVVPKGQWHTIEVHEPSVIYESKNSKDCEDGTETFGSIDQDLICESKDILREQITYLIGKERADGNLTELTAQDFSNHLHVPIEKVEQIMREMEL